MAGMMESKGVQMMLASLLKSAAPELMETVNSIGDFLRTIVQQLNRLEANQQEILRRLDNARHDNGGPRSIGNEIVGARNSVGGSEGNP